MRQPLELRRDDALVMLEDLACRGLAVRHDEIQVNGQLRRLRHVPEERSVLGRVAKIGERPVEASDRTAEALAPLHAVRPALGPRTAVEPGEERDHAVAAAAEGLAVRRPDEARRLGEPGHMLERRGREGELGRIRFERMELQYVLVVTGAQTKVQIALAGKRGRAPVDAVHLPRNPSRLRCVDEDPHRANVSEPGRSIEKSPVSGARSPLAGL